MPVKRSPRMITINLSKDKENAGKKKSEDDNDKPK